MWSQRRVRRSRDKQSQGGQSGSEAMGSGSSSQEPPEDTKTEGEIVNVDNSRALISMHVTTTTIVSSVSLFMVVMILLLVVCICIKCRLCKGLCHELCCTCCVEPPPAHNFMMQPAPQSADRSCLQESELPSRPALKAPSNSRNSSYSSNNDD